MEAERGEEEEPPVDERGRPGGQEGGGSVAVGTQKPRKRRGRARLVEEGKKLKVEKYTVQLSTRCPDALTFERQCRIFDEEEEGEKPSSAAPDSRPLSFTEIKSHEDLDKERVARHATRNKQDGVTGSPSPLCPASTVRTKRRRPDATQSSKEAKVPRRGELVDDSCGLRKQEAECEKEEEVLSSPADGGYEDEVKALLMSGARGNSLPQVEGPSLVPLPSAVPDAPRSPAVVPVCTLPEERPGGVRLATLTPRDVLEDSVLEVAVPGLRGTPRSVTDPRLGPLFGGTGLPCATCGSLDCLGHSGHIDLRQDVHHPAFVTLCVQTLRRLCYHCLGPAKLCQRNLKKVRKAGTSLRRPLRMMDIWLNREPTPTVEEPDPRLCAKRQPEYRVVAREGVAVVVAAVPGRQQQRAVELSASTIRAIFGQVPHRTWRYLGMKDPSDQVFVRYLRVCPLPCRPATQVNGAFYPSRLSVCYNNVVKLRNELDRLRLQIRHLLQRQDEVVRGGVHMLLLQQVDSMHCPGNQPGAAARWPRRTAARWAPDHDERRNKLGSDNALAIDSSLNADDGEQESDVEEKRSLNNPEEGGEQGEAEDEGAAASTPPLAEWLPGSDVDEEEGPARREEQGEAAREEEEETWDKEELQRTDRLHRLKQRVQEVAAQVCVLRQQARHKVLLLTAAVAAAIQRQVAKVTGKQGVLRHHLLGKRVNQCARAVFTGDNSLPLGVVGVPRVVAAKIFQYVHVHQGNLKECQALVRHSLEYPGVVAVTRGRQRIDLQKLRAKQGRGGGSEHGPLVRLQAGDMVQRHLMDGDQVVVCRQPTLAKANMETHTVRVTDSRTISLNISVTDNFAADCDGDEVNLFVPGVESHAGRLLEIEHNAVFPKSGKVSLRIKQDALRGAYSASLRDTFLTREEFTALMPRDCEAPPPALLKPRRFWTGLQLLSLALPPTLTVEQAGEPMRLDALLVRHGTMLSGVFDKGAQDKILECCKMFLGRKSIMATVQLLQAVAERFVDEVGGVGFTFLPEDWSCPAATLDTMRQELHDVLRRAQDIKCPLRRNAKLRQLLADQAKQLVPQLARKSNAAAMLEAGSKKRPQKLVQVCLAVGQHNQNDQLPDKHLDGRRLMPFFSRDDKRPQAEGFVDEPLLGVGSITADVLSGMVARSSSYKKHCATGQSGYLQRKLGKLMEDLTVRHDGTVRDANDEIVQLLYGDDGLLPECCVTVTLSSGPPPDHVADFYLTLIADRRLAKEERRLLRGELWALWCDRHRVGRDARSSPLEASVPFHLPHLMAHVLATVPAAGPPPSVTDIACSVQDFFAFLDHSIEKPLGEEARRRREEYGAVVEARRLQAAVASRAGFPMGPRPRIGGGAKLPEVNLMRELEMTAHEARRGAEQRLLGDPLATLKRYVRQHVNTLNVRQAGFSTGQLSALLEAMRRLYKESRPAAGEAVGSLAAQALAEPLMQMTLNACHRAAVASDGDAIPRLTELLNGRAEDALLELWQGGLQRARDYLVQEVGRVYAAAGEAVDVRHVRLVVDCMLKEGTMSGFTRYDVAPQTSFLKAAAFEQPLSLLQTAGRRGRGDGLRGVSENLILNEAADVGPDACDTLTWVGLREDTLSLQAGPLQSRQEDPPTAGHDFLDPSLPQGWEFSDSDNEFSHGSCDDDETEAMTMT